MKTFTKREWASWSRWSILVLIVHTMIIGLINDWNIFSVYQKDFYLFKFKSMFSDVPISGYITFHPRIFDVLLFPIFCLLFLLICKKNKELEDKESQKSFFRGIFIAITLSIILDVVAGIIPVIIFIVFITFVYVVFVQPIAAIAIAIGASIGIGIMHGIIFGLILAALFAWISLWQFIVNKVFSLTIWKKIFNWFNAKELE